MPNVKQKYDFICRFCDNKFEHLSVLNESGLVTPVQCPICRSYFTRPDKIYVPDLVLDGQYSELWIKKQSRNISKKFQHDIIYRNIKALMSQFDLSVWKDNDYVFFTDDYDVSLVKEIFDNFGLLHDEYPFLYKSPAFWSTASGTVFTNKGIHISIDNETGETASLFHFFSWKQIRRIDAIDDKVFVKLVDAEHIFEHKVLWTSDSDTEGLAGFKFELYFLLNILANLVESPEVDVNSALNLSSYTYNSSHKVSHLIIDRISHTNINDLRSSGLFGSIAEDLLAFDEMERSLDCTLKSITQKYEQVQDNVRPYVHKSAKNLIQGSGNRDANILSLVISAGTYIYAEHEKSKALEEIEKKKRFAKNHLSNSIMDNLYLFAEQVFLLHSTLVKLKEVVLRPEISINHNVFSCYFVLLCNTLYREQKARCRCLFLKKLLDNPESKETITCFDDIIQSEINNLSSEKYNLLINE